MSSRRRYTPPPIRRVTSSAKSGRIRERVKTGKRSLRLRVMDLHAEPGEEQVELDFTLGRGTFATAVLREIATY